MQVHPDVGSSRYQFGGIVDAEIGRRASGLITLLDASGASSLGGSGGTRPSSVATLFAALNRLARFDSFRIAIDVLPLYLSDAVLNVGSVWPERQADMMRHLRRFGFDFNRSHPHILGEAAGDRHPGPFDDRLGRDVVDRTPQPRPD